jgi:hypothetical protein
MLESLKKKESNLSDPNLDVISQKPLFKDKTSVMSGESQVLKQKNLFRGKK